MIGKFIYLTCRTRLDNTFMIEQLSKYNANLRKDYFWATKRVIRYLKRTMHMDLIFGKKPNNFLPKNLPSYDLIGYSDNNFT